MNKFYVTTPIYYVNSQPHVGHAYTTIAADVLARYYRMIGTETFFATGTDEHGAKIEEKALEEKKDPQAFTDEVAAKFELAWDHLNISHDRFIRTTEEGHMKAVQNALQQMYDNGDIYLGKYEGLYCRGCEQYKSEKDLVEGKCPDHKVEPEIISEDTYMFKMSKYQDELLKRIESDEFEINPVERKNEIVQFYKQEGLKDISFSRKNVKWGIPLPWDAEHTAYVWSDAFLNYLTILNWTGEKGSAPSMWPANVQLMSKDILRVHATIWPAMLLSLGLELPKSLFIHGFFTIDGEKMSKSLGNGIDPIDLVSEYGSDAARYLILSQFHFGNDGDIKKDEFVAKYNADLANGIGNLVSRVLGMTEKYFDNKVPAGKYSAEFAVADFWDKYDAHFSDLKLYENIGHILDLVKFCDGYVDLHKPWALAKTDKDKLAEVLYNLLELIRHLSYAILPYLPETAESIWQKLSITDEKQKTLAELKETGLLKAGTTLEKGEPLFLRK